MEPFSIATGVFACLQAVELLAKCSRSLYRSGKSIKGANSEIATFAGEVGLFGGIIGAACTALQPYCEMSNEENPPIIKYLMENRVLVELIEQSRLVTDEVCGYLPSIRDLRRRPRFFVAVKWVVFLKREIEAMAPRMESVKRSINVVINIMLLEALRLEPRTEAVNREMEVSEHIPRVEMWNLC